MTLAFVPLDCPKCGSALRAEPFDTLFLCRHCRAGAVLANEGLQMIDSTALLPAPGRRADLWRPAWVIEARVRIDERIAADGRRTPVWEGLRTFIIPAFSLTLQSLTELARALSAVAGVVGEVPEEPVTGGVLTVDDALTLAQHLVVAEEVHKPDLLASLLVSLSPVNQRLAAVPFSREGTRLRCAVTGVEVRAEE